MTRVIRISSIDISPTPHRATEVLSSLAAVRTRIAAAAAAKRPPVLVAVSKYKPAADIAAAYAAGQRDFGENYVQELADKAPVLPADIRWHFIGHLQSNKAKTVAAIANLHTLHTLTSTRLASTLNKARADADVDAPLHVLLQVNTSGEESKSGLPPLDTEDPDAELVALARHVITMCPRLRLTGLMTIGALENSRAGDENADFDALRGTRDILEAALARDFSADQWGDPAGRLTLSMGMSADYEAAIRAGSGIVRVGSSIFGGRPQKQQVV